jgi:hypothetical protein
MYCLKLPFHQGILDPKQHDWCPPHNLFTWLGILWLFFAFPIDFITTAVIKTESQAELNTLLEHYFQDALKMA